MIFDDTTRTDIAPANGGESAFHFLNRSAWRRCELVRRHINSWVIPLMGDAEFVSQIKSDDDRKHAAAIFELIIYTLLSKTGFELVKHPPGARRTTPDFKAVHSSGIRSYLECKLSGNSFERIEEEKRKKGVENIIREIEFFPYFINLSFINLSLTSLSKKALVNFIRSLEDSSDGFTNEELFQIRHRFEHSGWILEISLVRKSDPGIRGSLGMIMNKARTIDHVKPALNALNDKKPSRYGLLDAPYLIALDNKDMFLNEEEFNEVLFGFDVPERLDLSYSACKGFFFNDGKAVNTSVSGVVLCKNMNILTLDQARITIWHNPFAKQPLPVGIFPVDEYYYDADGYSLSKRLAIKNFHLISALGFEKDDYLTDPKEPF
jgi:hypothetical protein